MREFKTYEKMTCLAYIRLIQVVTLKMLINLHTSIRVLSEWWVHLTANERSERMQYRQIKSLIYVHIKVKVSTDCLSDYQRSGEG